MGFSELLKIMHRLRRQCPWDAQQSRQSLKPFLIEECYEVIEAIDTGNPALIKEELGDLLFQIVFHAEIAQEKGEFTMADVIESISEKMKRRHPHVFGGARYRTAEEVKKHWDEHKRAEGKLRESALEGVPSAMPALLRAKRLQERAARIGFDWSRIEDTIHKLDEEVAEFKEALGKGSKASIEDELGDIFFMLVNISRFVGIDPENALRKTINKFIHRFRYMEMKAAEKGLKLNDMSLEDMDKLWNEAKGARPPARRHRLQIR